jgi:hypothetical protein
MADNNVYITGTETGAFETAFGRLPPWASQRTTEIIEGHLRRSMGIQADILKQLKDCCAGNTGGAGGNSSEQTKKFNNEVLRASKLLAEQNAEEEKKLKRRKKENDEEEVQGKQTKKSLSLGDMFNKTLAGMTGISSKLLGVQKQYYITSDALFKSGVNMLAGNDSTTSSMTALNQMIDLTGLRLETLQKIVEEFGPTVNAVGMSKFTKAVNGADQQLREYGFTTEETAELIGVMMTAEAGYSDVRKRSTDQLVADAVNLGRELTDLSLYTGQSSKALQASIKALSKNTDSTVVSARYGKDAANRLNMFASTFGNEGIKVLIQKLGASANPQNTQAYKNLITSGMGPFGDSLAALAASTRDGSMSAEEASRQLKEMASAIPSSELDRMQLVAEKSGSASQETLGVIQALREAQANSSEATDNQTTAAKESQTAISNFSSELERSQSLLQVTFPLLETQVQLAADALKLVNDAAKGVIGIFDEQVRSWTAVGFQLATVAVQLGAFSIALLKATASAAGKAGKFGGVAGAAAAGYAIGTVLYNLISKFEWFTDLMDYIFTKIDKVLQYISPEAKARVKSREANELAAAATPVTPKISIKTPAPATIASPSAVPADPATVPNKTSPTTQPTSPVGPASGIEKPPGGSDINSIIGYQSSILEQILQGTKDLVTVNKDILKRTMP